MKAIEFIQENWELISLTLYGVFEILARIIPTKINLSTIDKIKQLLDALIPNVRKPDGSEIIPVVGANEPENKKAHKVKNLIKFAVNRFIKTLLLILLVQFAHAQIWQNFKGIRLVNQLDSNTVLPVNGSIWYNEEKPYPRFQVWENDTLKNLIQSSGGGGTILGTISPTQVAFGQAPNTILGDPDFVWDEALNTLQVDGQIRTGTVADLTGNNGLILDASTVQLTDITGNSIDMSAAGLNFNGPPGIAFTSTNPLNITSQGGTFSGGRFTFDPDGSIPGVNVGQQPGDPTSLVNGDIWYNSATGNLRTRIAGTSVSLGAAGITNTAGVNEIPKSNGTNIVPSGLFSSTDGSMLLGNTSDAGALRSLLVQGSATDIQLRLIAKGASPINIQGGTIACTDAASFRIDINPSLNRISNSKLGSDRPLDLRGAAGSALLNNGDGVSLNSGEAYNLAGNGNGGSISIITGAGFGTGLGGNINMNAAAGGEITAAVSDVGLTGGLTMSPSGYNTTMTQTGVSSSQVLVQPSDANISWVNAAATAHSLVTTDASGVTLDTNGNGNISMTVVSGFIIMLGLPADCTGAPTGALANVAGTLTVCP